MRFRDPRNDKIKFVADDKGNVLIFGNNGEVTGKILAEDSDAPTEEVPVTPEDFGGESKLLKHPQTLPKKIELI
jgi:hypothetical protein